MKGKPVNELLSIRPYDNRHATILTTIKDAQVQSALTSADVILLPTQGHADYAGPVFPAGTRELFQYINRRADSTFRVEVASADTDYRELTLHSAEWILPFMLLANPTAQVAINIISNYIYDKMKALLPGVSAKVISDVVLKTDVGSFELHYKGPAETYESVMLEAIDTVTKPEDGNEQ